MSDNLHYRTLIIVTYISLNLTSKKVLQEYHLGKSESTALNEEEYRNNTP